MHFADLILQMPHGCQVVRLTCVEHVPGYLAFLYQPCPTMICRGIPSTQCTRSISDYGQGQFFCEVRVLNPEGDGVQHIARGIGITVEQAVQEAAYHAITRYRYEWPYLAADYCPFRYFPNAADGAEGVYRSVYASASDHPDPTVRCLVEMLNAKDHRAHCGASMLSQVT
jgi:hypothetical protein